MAQINFPAASESPWFNPDNGVTYEFVGGTWRTVSTASSLDDIYVKEIGDTMTGELILYGDPVQNLGATPKQYVDTAISSSEGGETGRLDSRYLRKDAAAGDQTVASTGTTTFSGLTEHGGGVKVTGGAEDISRGIYSPSSNTLGIALSDSDGDESTPIFTQVGTNFSRVRLGKSDSDVNIAQGGVTVTTVPADKNSTTEIAAIVNINSEITDNLATELDGYDLVGVNTTLRIENPFTTPYQEVNLYRANDFYQNRSNVYGYYGNISLGTGSSRFNFFAGGDASNFFAGNTFIGGTTARNTRELWESLLTEEQKEELAAETLVVPANVSTPGDGEFVRQWWYDQQSAEDQALIDAGELDYPEHFAAATFTDTFVLGDNTSINLLSNGRGEFGGGVKVTGGDISKIDYGVLKTGAGSLGIRCNNKYTYVASSVGTIALGGSTPETQQQVRLNSNFPNGDAIGYYNAGIIQNNTTSASYIRSYLQEDVSQPTNITDVKLFDADHPTTGSIDTNLTVTNIYGFYSNVRETPRFTNAYNFYAEGDAPNYFRGDILSGNIDTSPYVHLHASGTIESLVPGQIDGTYAGFRAFSSISTQTTDTNKAFAVFNLGTSEPTFSISYLGNTTRAIGTGVYELTDRRVLSSLTSISDATSKVKQLSPGVEGFIADEVQSVVSNAVLGNQDATEAIGTLADFDGTVLQTEVIEPPAEELEYTVKVVDELQPAIEGEEPRMVEVTRTRTWTATGTRPVYQGVDQTKLIPLLTKALQEALERIEALEAAQ